MTSDPSSPLEKDFAPADPYDGRKDLFDYKSKWDEVALKAQKREGIYLSVLGFIGVGGILSILLCTSITTADSETLKLFTQLLTTHPELAKALAEAITDKPELATVLETTIVNGPAVARSTGLVFLAGLLGGTAFDTKWWYHSIAKGIWHLDRRAWRLSVPWIAATMAAFVYILFKSDLIGILNPAAFDKLYNGLAFGFLVGYFSDSAIAKLAEIAESLFGTTRASRGNRR